MKRFVITGALLALGAAGLLAQPTTAQPPAAAPAAAPKGPTPKSQGELDALKAVQAASQGGDADAIIKAADDLLTKYPDTDFKSMVLNAEAGGYQQKRDWIKAQIFAEQSLAVDPKSYQSSLMLADIIAQHTGEHDLDKEEKLTKADKYAHQAVDLIGTAPKPNPQITDQQWEDYKKPFVGQAQHDIALINMTRKNWDAAIAAFKVAIAMDPQPAYEVQMASCLQSEGKNDEAIVLCDKVLAEPNLHPQIKAAALGIKDNATRAKSK